MTERVAAAVEPKRPRGAVGAGRVCEALRTHDTTGRPPPEARGWARPRRDLLSVPARAGGLPPILRQATSRCACGGSAGPDGECAACRQRRLAAERGAAAARAPEELVSKPGDAVEIEADRIAAGLVQPGQRTPPIGGSGSVPPILRSARESGPRQVPSPVAGVVRAAGPGHPLDTRTRREMEAGLGTSLSSVRVHAGPAAVASSRALAARAYTVGDHVVFGAGAYAPASADGRRLLAHELVHVVQSRAAGTPPAIMRQACGHDGRPPECGAGGLGRWRLVDMVTDAVTNVALDDLIVNQGLAPRFGGTWVTQVYSPPNPQKSGTDRGRVDGMKVSLGSALRLEVVEIKSRGTQFNGGCALATREAQGYVEVLRRIAPRVVAISRALAPGGGLRVTKSISAADRARLRTAGVDLTDPLTRQAFAFYNSLQNRLGQTLTTPLSSMEVAVNSDGTPSTSYPVITVLVDCKTRGKPGVRTRELAFQVNKVGGVSYGCENSQCEDEERERKRQAQAVPRTGAQPAAQPVAQPGQAQGQRQQPSEHDDRPGDPKPTPAHDPTLPIVVGTGLAVGAAAALARRRAAQIAARKAAELAAKKALQAAWRREAEELAAHRLARQGAGKVAGKAVAYAEIAAAAALVIFYSDRAEAHIGPGESSIESLYKAMTASGHPPSPELRQLIESDPVLKELAEHAAKSGDASGLQEEATRRVMELVRDNPGEFSPEDLEMLAQFAHTSGTGAHGPETADQIRAAIEAARRGTPGGSGATTPRATGSGGTGTAGGTTPAGGTAPAGGTTAAAGPKAPTGAGAGPTAAAPSGELPGLTPAGRALLPVTGSPVRNLFDAMVGATGTGIGVTDEAVRRFLGTVPADLSSSEASTIIRQLHPVASETLDEVLQRLASSVRSIRSHRTPDRAHPVAAQGKTPTSTPAHPSPGGRQAPGEDAAGQPAAATKHPHPAKPGTPAAPSGPSPSTQKRAAISDEEYIDRAIAAIDAFGTWESVPVGAFRFLDSGGQDWRHAPVNTRLLGWAYTRVQVDSGVVRAVAILSLVIVGRRGETVKVRIDGAGPVVVEDRRTVQHFRVGSVIEMAESH